MDVPTQKGNVMAQPVVHFEVIGKDPDRLRGYYGDLFGWTFATPSPVIVDLVRSVASAGANYVSPADRVAVFDIDGTLWSEKPIPIQLDFTLYRLAEQARSDSTLSGREPYRAALKRDYRWLGEAMVKHYHGDESALDLLLRAVESAFVGMSVRPACGGSQPVAAQRSSSPAWARDRSWTVISIADDWSTVFGDEVPIAAE